MTIIGVPALRLKKAARSPLAVRRPVHAEQRGGAGDAAPVQQVADGHEGGDAGTRAPGGRGRWSAWSPRRPPRSGDRPSMSPVSSRARSRVTSPAPSSRAVGSSSPSIRGRLSTATAISGRSSDRVSDRSVRSVAPGAEPLGAAQQNARRDLVPPVQVEQRIGGEAVAGGPLPLAEVAGELEAVRIHRCAIHSCAPISRPSAAAADAEHQADDDVEHRLAVLPLLGQPLRLQHPGGEGRVGADGRGADAAGTRRAQRQPAQQAEDHRPGHVDHHGAEREVPPGRGGHQPVDVKPEQRARRRR